MRKSAIVAFALAAALVACGGAGTAAPPRKPSRPQPVLGTPGPLALTPDGRALLVGDRTFRRVLRVDLRTKRRTIVIGRLPDAPVGLAFDDNGRLFVASGNRIYLMAGGRKVVVAGTGERSHTGDGGAATAATIGGIVGIDVDHDDEIAIAEYDNWVRVVGADGIIRTVAGNGGTGTAGDGGPATDALLGHPHDVIWRANKTLVIADSHNGRLRSVDSSGLIRLHAEGFAAPVEITGGPGNTIYVSDARLGAIFRVPPGGGDAQRVAFADTAVGIAVDALGILYYSELEGRRRVLRRTPGGRMTVLADGR